jgi:hypothetical protein
MLLSEQTRKTFVKLGYEGKACKKLENDNRDDEFLVSRLLFLTTYNTEINLIDLVEKHHLGNLVAQNLERHVQRRNSSEVVSDAMDEMALVETLKLLFNVTHFCHDKSSAFTSVVPPIVTLLSGSYFRTEKPLDSPITFLINGLLNLDLGDAEIQASLYPEDSPKKLMECLIGILDQSRNIYSDAELESTVTPLLGVIRGIHEFAPADVKASMRSQLLPTEADRAEVLGQSDSLPSWLLKNTTNALTPKMRDTIGGLLFDLSDKDPHAFVGNVGYGYASGYLFSHQLPVPPNVTGADDGTSRPVNPVTGQFLDRESQPDAREMTEEEKEREAERLFVLFER